MVEHLVIAGIIWLNKVLLLKVLMVIFLFVLSIHFQNAVIMYKELIQYAQIKLTIHLLAFGSVILNLLLIKHMIKVKLNIYLEKATK